MNLLIQSRWDHAFPWGTIINPDSGNEVCLSAELVSFKTDGSVHFGCKKGPCQGWKTDKNGTPVPASANWSVGAIIANNAGRTHFGTYLFSFKLPDFRGSWPAIWLVDLHPGPPGGNGMGIPPEIDVMEHMRKDGFLSRFSMTHSFHQGPVYSEDTVVRKRYWKLWPLDAFKLEIVFTWSPEEMIWNVNGKKVLTLPSSTAGYPLKPMNLVINSGLGPEWNPDQRKFSDFVILKAEYNQEGLGTQGK